VPIGGGIHAPELHSDSPEAIYAHTPGLKVVIPSHPYDAKGLLLSAIRDPDPVIFFEPKRVYRSFKEEVPEEDYTIPIGQAKVLSEGTDLTIVTWGAMVFQCLDALDHLPEDVSVELVDLRTIYPIDIETIAESVRKTGRAVVVHEAPKTAGMGAEVSTLIQEHCFLYLEAPVQRVTGFDTVMPFYKLEQAYLPNVERITACIRDCLAY
jgi:pyruvate dehydrogenase E1 component beta subunit